MFGALLLAGCFGGKNPAANAHPKMIVTVDQGLEGKVVKAESNLQFVILNFPLGQMPAIGQRLVVYRNGLKIGELKVSGPQQDDNIIADVTTGEAAAGDDVRDR